MMANLPEGKVSENAGIQMGVFRFPKTIFLARQSKWIIRQKQDFSNYPFNFLFKNNIEPKKSCRNKNSTKNGCAIC